LSERVFINEEGVFVERNGHVIHVEWFKSKGRRFISISIDGNHCLTLRASATIYNFIIEPIIKGVVGDDVIECLKLIASTYRGMRARMKYATALAYIGPSIRKWIGKSPRAYLKRKADLIHVRPPYDYLLAFICNGGWIIADMKFETIYAYIRSEGESSFYIFDCYKDHFDIALAELLPALKEDLRNIQRLNSLGFDGGDRRLPTLLGNRSHPGEDSNGVVEAARYRGISPRAGAQPARPSLKPLFGIYPLLFFIRKFTFFKLRKVGMRLVKVKGWCSVRKSSLLYSIRKRKFMKGLAKGNRIIYRVRPGEYIRFEYGIIRLKSHQAP